MGLTSSNPTRASTLLITDQWIATFGAEELAEEDWEEDSQA